ncbi:hypothetical protein RhiirA4_455949 [Rhizophagus irregularis]|uniref:Uncharacterized protein n=1 Tax=Rhizophagus irregularis TaxID=588596 RepID=A0A2I1G6E4_9GLOM|nr:hypothetical protein RhiirA4_455949 [Rhizophagus irregularis]
MFYFSQEMETYRKYPVYYNLNDKITLVKKWIEKKLENEYIRYFKYDEFIIDEEEIGRGRDIRIPMVLSSYFGRHFGGSFVFLVFCKVSNSRIGYWNLEMKGFDCVPGDWRRSRLQIVFWSP